jgi:hypothetical protein
MSALPAFRGFRAIVGALALVSLLAGCASVRFPPEPPTAAFADDLRAYPGDINLSTDGLWFALIQRIQPLVSDSGFRIRSEERYRPRDGLYAVSHTGPQGIKHVVRSREGLTVSYNCVVETDPAKLRATAMTNDAFRMFHFGPSFFLDRVTTWTRVDDAEEGGRRFHRLRGTLRPGFGEAAEDVVLLWIDRADARLYRIHMSLNGFETTVGAHVDTTFLEYRKVDGHLLPVRFHERVRGPLRIDAHTWWTTGIDTGRGWVDAEVQGAFTGAAALPAASLSP